MRKSAFIAGVLFLVAGTARAEVIVCDATVLTLSWELIAQAAYGQSEFEHAAFIIRNDAGQYEFLAWPFNREFRGAHFSGPIPERVEAIIHTHPNVRPFPSDDDAALAQRTGLPVYVLTRKMVSWTDGRRPHVVWNGDWSPQSNRRISGRCDMSSPR